MKISDSQARIAKSLVSGPKSLGELKSELGLAEDEIKKELDSLVSLGLVRVGNDKYRLIEAVRRGIESGREIRPSEYSFRAYVIVEGMSDNRSALENAQEAVVSAFKSDPRFEVLDMNVEDIIENEGTYSSMFEAEVLTKNFHDLVYLILTYGPSSIELIEPASFEIKASEAQAVLVDIAEMMHIYTQTITKLQKELGPREPKIKLEINKK